MKVAIFGGSFDPVHKGHIRNAEYILWERKPEKLILVPAYISPFKQGIQAADAHHRLQMLSIAFTGLGNVEISDFEINREGISFTVDTLRHFSKIYSEIELIIGYDNLLSFDRWHEPDEIIKMCKLIVLRRKIDGNMPDNKYFEQAVFLNSPLINISSSEIRNRLVKKLPVEEFIPHGVIEYIKQKKLYSA